MLGLEVGENIGRTIGQGDKRRGAKDGLRKSTAHSQLRWDHTGLLAYNLCKPSTM